MMRMKLKSGMTIDRQSTRRPINYGSLITFLMYINIYINSGVLIETLMSRARHFQQYGGGREEPRNEMRKSKRRATAKRRKVQLSPPETCRLSRAAFRYQFFGAWLHERFAMIKRTEGPQEMRRGGGRKTRYEFSALRT